MLTWILSQRPCLVRKNDMVGFLCLPWSSAGETSALVLCLPPWQPWIIIVILGKEYRKGSFLEMLANSAIFFAEGLDSYDMAFKKINGDTEAYSTLKKKKERKKWMEKNNLLYSDLKHGFLKYWLDIKLITLCKYIGQVRGNILNSTEKIRRRKRHIQEEIS